MCFVLIYSEAQYKLDHTVVMHQHPLIAPKQTSMKMINWLLRLSVGKSVDVSRFLGHKGAFVATSQGKINTALGSIPKTAGGDVSETQVE